MSHYHDDNGVAESYCDQDDDDGDDDGEDDDNDEEMEDQIRVTRVIKRE